MIRGEFALPSAVLFLAYLAGCSQQQIAAVAAPPPPGGPEVFIPKTPIRFVRYRIITRLLGIGATLDQDSDGRLVFALSSTKLAYRMLLGRHEEDVLGKIELKLVEFEGGTRVWGTVQFVQHRNTPQEQIRQASNAELPKMQGMLNLLRDSFASLEE